MKVLIIAIAFLFVSITARAQPFSRGYLIENKLYVPGQQKAMEVEAAEKKELPSPLDMNANRPDITKELIQSEIYKQMGPVTACYVKFAQKDPSLSGTVVGEWYVRGGGKNRKTKIKSTTFKNKELNKCFETAIKKIMLPAPGVRKEYTTSHPFSFAGSSQK